MAAWRCMGQSLIRHKTALDFSVGLWLGKELEITNVDVNLLVDMDYLELKRHFLA